jgi:hypothetical protein
MSFDIALLLPNQDRDINRVERDASDWHARALQIGVAIQDS